MGRYTGKQIMAATGTVTALILLMLVSALVVSSLASNIVLTESTLSGAVTNETGAYINETGYTLALATATSFASPVITALYNATDDTAFGVGNATVSATGVVTNATVTNWDDVLVSYTYTYTDGSTSSGVNITAVSAAFGLFITALVGFFGVIGVIIAIVWLIGYIKPLFDKKDGIQSFAGN
jgi:hypothetical protein